MLVTPNGCSKADLLNIRDVVGIFSPDRDELHRDLVCQ